MNETQKKIMIAVVIGLVISFLFPPHAFGDRGVRMGYAFIGNIPYGASVHLIMLFAEWLCIAMIGGIFYFITQDVQREYTSPSQFDRSKGNPTGQMSTPGEMNKYKKWLIRLIGFLFVSIIYSIWRELDKETGGLFPGSALLRGALLGISLLWIFSIGNTQRTNNELKSDSKKLWFVIGAILLASWLIYQTEDKTNTLVVPTQLSQQAQTEEITSVPEAPTQSIQQVQAGNNEHINANSTSNSRAEEILGRANDLYSQGKYADALPLFRQLAETGLPDAQNNLGWMHYKGQAVAKDDKKAVYWYRKAAKQGYATAQNNLGGMYNNGYGIAQDYSQAFHWYQKAAEQGDEIAQNNLGTMYDNGHGIAQDYSQAFHWYKKAAEHGYALAQYELGKLYHNGEGVSQDYNQAIAWYTKAAKQGEPFAQNNLGFMYENGYGVTRNIDEAMSWYRKAAARGQENAIENLKRLNVGVSNQ